MGNGKILSPGYRASDEIVRIVEVSKFMSDMMAVLLNGEAVIEYDREKSLSEKQQDYLQKLDQQMARGIELGGEFIASPDLQQKSMFMAQQLMKALRDDQDAVIAASCSWLASRLPDLRQVRAKHQEQPGSLLIDLVFDEEYKNQVKVDFAF